MQNTTAAPDARFVSIQIDTKYITPGMIDILKDFVSLTNQMEVTKLYTQMYHCLAEKDDLCPGKKALLAMLIQMSLDFEKERNLILAGNSKP